MRGDPGSSVAASLIGVGDVDDRGSSPDIFFSLDFIIIIIALLIIIAIL